MFTTNASANKPIKRVLEDLRLKIGFINAQIVQGRNTIKPKIPNNNKILAFMNTTDSIYIIKALEFKGYKIDFAILEDAKTIDFGKYDYVITPNNVQKSSYIKYYEKRKNDYEIKNNKVVFDKEVLTPCIYEKNLTIQKSKNEESRYPFQSLCGMKQKFIDNNHLIPIIAAGLIAPNAKELSYYIIYMNPHPKKN